MAASFSQPWNVWLTHRGATGRNLHSRRGWFGAAPFIGLVLVLSVMIAANPAVASVFGLDLLLMPALSLVSGDGSANVRCRGQRDRSWGRRVCRPCQRSQRDMALRSGAALARRPSLALSPLTRYRGGYSRPQDPGDRRHPWRVFHLGWAWVLDPADAWRDEPRVAHRNDQLVDQPVRSYVHRSDRGGRASGRSARSLSAWRHPSRLWIEPDTRWSLQAGHRSGLRWSAI